MTWHEIYIYICIYIWHDTTWCDLIHYTTWYMIWFDMIWYDIWYMIWYMIWYDMIYDMIWSMIWYDMPCHAMPCHAMPWHLAWHGMAWHGMVMLYNAHNRISMMIVICTVPIWGLGIIRGNTVTFYRLMGPIVPVQPQKLSFYEVLP